MRLSHLLAESAKRPEDLPEGWFVCIDHDLTRWRIYFSDQNGKFLGYGSGRIEILPMRDGSPMSYMVRSSDAMHGWGPMLYDLALEFAEAGGLRPDQQVSDAAEAVWGYYRTKRPDVEVQWRIDEHGREYEVFVKPTSEVRDTIYRMGRLIER